MPTEMSSKCNYNLCSNSFAIMLLLFIHVQSKSVHYEEICSNFDGRRMYVELGKKGMIIASTKSTDNIEFTNLKKFNSYKQCRLELISCPACIISVKFTFLNTSRSCDGNDPTLSSCTCDYIWIYEPPFDHVSGHQFCGHYTNINSNDSLLVYRSKTRTVAIIFFYTRVYQHAFTLQYTSEPNRQVVQGYHGHYDNTVQIISTPFFPLPYPRDLNIEFVIRCNDTENCVIYLIFTDFFVAKISVVEFFDWNGRRIDAATGLTFRPPAIISSGPALTVRFYANGVANIGFKAEYNFGLRNDVIQSIIKPKINCGGLVDNLAGAITMINVVKESVESFDCVWIVQPSRNFVNFYTHLYLKVLVFSDFAKSAELSVHRGVTSFGVPTELLKYPPFLAKNPRRKQHILPISEGYYLRFKGTLRAESELVVAYTAFNYNECISGSDFLCKNQRCIPIYLQCDGLDHCGDNSDEPVTCFQDKNRKWSRPSNFFFPKTDQYTDLHAAAIVFIICCFGLVSLILALIILIFRVTGRVRQQREMQDHLQAISDLLEEDTPSIQEEIIEDDDPPVYEAPPNYDEADRSKFDSSDRQRRSERRAATGKGGARSKVSLRRGTCSRCSQRIKVASSQYVRMTIEQEEILSSSSQVSTGESSRMIHIPESPPPAYVSALHNFDQLLTDTTPSNKTEGINNILVTSDTNSTNYLKLGTSATYNLFVKHFSNDDFGILKMKLLQKSKRQKLFTKNKRFEKFASNLSENLSHCLSDSELSEINTFEDSSSSPKLQRSFSFDDL